MADISLVSRVRTYGEIIAKNMARTAGRPDLNGDICYLENIYGAEQP